MKRFLCMLMILALLAPAALADASAKLEGPGYDWHFRHAIILRQGRVYRDGIERFSPGKRRVVLLGDETASAQASAYAGAQVFDMGFKGDRTQNVLWRLSQRPLPGFSPHVVVISVGLHNAGENTAEEIERARTRIVQRVRVQVPDAEVIVLKD